MYAINLDYEHCVSNKTFQSSSKFKFFFSSQSEL